MGLIQLSVILTDSYHLIKGKLFLSPGCRGFCPWLFGPIHDFGLLVAQHGVKEETGVLEPLLKVLQLPSGANSGDLFGDTSVQASRQV